MGRRENFLFILTSKPPPTVRAKAFFEYEVPLQAVLSSQLSLRRFPPKFSSTNGRKGLALRKVRRGPNIYVKSLPLSFEFKAGIVLPKYLQPPMSAARPSILVRLM